MKQILTHRAVGNPSISVASYAAFCGGTDFNTDETIGGYLPWAASGTLRNLIVKLSTAPGSGKSFVFTVRVNGVDSGVTVTIADTDTTARDITNSVSVSAGDYVSLKAVPSGTPTSAGADYPQLCIEFESTSAGESVYGRPRTSIVSTGTSGYYFAPFTGDGWFATASHAADVVPCDGSITAMYSIVSANLSATVTQLALYVNGVKQDGSGGTQDTRCETGNTGLGLLSDSATFNIPVVAGDTVYIGVEKQNAEWPGIRFGVRFTATTDGQSIVAGGGGTPSASATNYGKAGNAPAFYQVTESAQTTLGGVTSMTLGRLHMRCVTAPGASKDFTHTLRKNTANATPTVTIGGAATTTGSDTTNAATIADGDVFAMISVPTGTPTASVFRWALTQTVAIVKTGIHVLGVDGTVTTTRTGLINLDGVTRTVAGPGVQFIGGANGYIEQSTAPAAIANTALIYAIDNGAGKTKLMVQFPTGAAIQLSIEV
jgi:hypothetical protein